MKTLVPLRSGLSFLDRKSKSATSCSFMSESAVGSAISTLHSARPHCALSDRPDPSAERSFATLWSHAAVALSGITSTIFVMWFDFVNWRQQKKTKKLDPDGFGKAQIPESSKIILKSRCRSKNTITTLRIAFLNDMKVWGRGFFWFFFVDAS